MKGVAMTAAAQELVQDTDTLEPTEQEKVKAPSKKTKPVRPEKKTRAARAAEASDEAKEIPVSELSSHQVGLIGETLATNFIESHGWEIIERNWTCYCGEADLIIKDGDEIAFVEIKTRVKTGENQFMPELNVTSKKCEKYRKIIEAYLASRPGIEKTRFDVMGIYLKTERRASVHYVKDIFLDVYDE